MLTFKSPVIHENIWKIVLKTNKELNAIYNKDKKEKRNNDDIGGVIEYSTMTIYIDKNLDDSLFRKAFRKQLMNLYLWETGQEGHLFTQEDFCDLASVVAPLICKTADEILLKIRNGGNKNE